MATTDTSSSSASEFFRAVSAGTTRKLRKQEFADLVFCDRERWAGGDMHRRLLWTECIFNFRISSDCPQDLRDADPHALAVAALNFSEHKTVPSERALLLAWEAMRKHREHLEERRRLSSSPAEQRRRRAGVRARADAQRAEERRRRCPGEESYRRVIEAASRELEKLPNMRPRVLSAVLEALESCKVDDEGGGGLGRRSAILTGCLIIQTPLCP
jgi:hypothetical protein